MKTLKRDTACDYPGYGRLVRCSACGWQDVDTPDTIVEACPRHETHPGRGPHGIERVAS